MTGNRQAVVLEPVEHDDRRQAQRYKLRAPGLVADESGAYDCIVADISIGGAMLEGDLPLTKGQKVALAFDSLIGIFGDVVHTREGFVGVKFSGGDDQSLILMNWVDARLRPARL